MVGAGNTEAKDIARREPLDTEQNYQEGWGEYEPKFGKHWGLK